MTETVSKNFQQWIGDGMSDVFTLSNVTLLDESNLAVYLDDIIQTIVTDYTVEIEFEIASIAFSSPPSSGQRVSIVREEPLEQNTDLTTINTFRAEGFEGALDAIVRQIYRLWHRLSRSLTLPDSNMDGSGQFDARSNRIGNVADPISEQDAVTKSFADDTYALQSSAGGDMFKAAYDTDGDGKVNEAVAADIAPWSGLTGIPASFTPATHTHTATDVDDFNTAVDARVASSAQDISIWEIGTGITEGVVSPAKIAAAIATIAPGGGDMIKATYDSNNNGKVDAADVADVAPWAGLTGVPATFAPSAHSHTAADVSDFNASADARISAALGVSVQAYQAAQAQAIWEAGTGTTSSIVSPAHLAAAIVALAPSGGGIPHWTTLETDTDISGGSSYDVDLPTSYDEFWLEFRPMHSLSDNNRIAAYFSDDGGTTVETSGYVGGDTDVAKWYDANAWDNGDDEYMRVHITRVSGTLLFWESHFGSIQLIQTSYTGYFDSGSAVDLVRVSPDTNNWGSNSRLTVRAR